MTRAKRPRKHQDSITRFTEMFPEHYFKSDRRAAQSLGEFSTALQSGQLVTVFVKPKGWVMKGPKNRRVKLDRWKRKNGIETR